MTSKWAARAAPYPVRGPHARFAAEKVTSLLADWDEAPEAYAARTTKLVLHREPLDLAKAPLASAG